MEQISKARERIVLKNNNLSGYYSEGAISNVTIPCLANATTLVQFDRCQTKREN